MGFTLTYLIAAASALGFWLGGAWVFTSLVLAIGIGIVMDEWLKDFRITSPFWSQVILNRSVGEVFLRLSPLLLFSFVGFSLWRIQSLETFWEKTVTLLSAGVIMSNIAINAAHELIHRRSRLLKCLGTFDLVLVNYGLYRIWHVENHHEHVGTEQDPCTAKPGQGYWSFAVSCYWDNVKMTFSKERQRVGLFSLSNRVWHDVLMTLVMGAVFWIILGPMAIPLWIVISIISILGFQAIEYVEHNGLLRSTTIDGDYEDIAAFHSVDCHHFISSLLFFKVGYHANHHLRTKTDFSNLGPVHGAELMPYGYSLMVVRAYLGLETMQTPTSTVYVPIFSADGDPAF